MLQLMNSVSFGKCYMSFSRTQALYWSQRPLEGGEGVGCSHKITLERMLCTQWNPHGDAGLDTPYIYCLSAHPAWVKILIKGNSGKTFE